MELLPMEKRMGMEKIRSTAIAITQAENLIMRLQCGKASFKSDLFPGPKCQLPEPCQI